MKRCRLRVFLLAVCFIVFPLNYVSAQDSIELPEIRGENILEYKEIKIEVTGIRRLQSYQPYWYKSDRLRGSRFVAKDGFEIALVLLHTTRRGASRGIKINHLYLFDARGKKYEGDLVSIFFLGARSDAESDPLEHDYEFPVFVPAGTIISAIQIQEFSSNDSKPFFVFQNLFFNVSKFNW